MFLREQIQQARQIALKSGDKAALGTLRMLWSAIRMEEIDAKKDLDDAAVERVVGRQVKQLQDALLDFEKGGRTDLVDATNAEVRLLSAYLPVQLSDGELRPIVERALAASGMKEKSQIGRVMGIAMKEVIGRADGNRVRAMIERMMA